MWKGYGSLLDSLSNEFQAHLGTKGGKHCCIYVVHVDHHNVRQCMPLLNVILDYGFLSHLFVNMQSGDKNLF